MRRLRLDASEQGHGMPTCACAHVQPSRRRGSVSCACRRACETGTLLVDRFWNCTAACDLARVACSQGRCRPGPVNAGAEDTVNSDFIIDTTGKMARVTAFLTPMRVNSLRKRSSLNGANAGSRAVGRAVFCIHNAHHRALLFGSGSSARVADRANSRLCKIVGVPAAKKSEPPQDVSGAPNPNTPQ